MREKVTRPRLGLPIRFYLNVCLALLVVAFASCQGETKDSKLVAVIAGGSMAPTLLGEHFQLSCEDCGIRFSVDGEAKPASRHAVCPNCGFDQIQYSKERFRGSEERLISAGNKEIKRWDIVAFEFDESKKKGVKRVVGLPGETVRILRGDIWIDGKLAERSLETKKQMMILNHDSSFVAKSPELLPWILGAQWSFHNNEFTYQRRSKEVANEPLTHRPFCCFQSSENRKPIPGIQDDYGFNQANSRAVMHFVDQLFVSLTAELPPNSRLIFSTVRFGTQFTFVIDREKQEVRIESEADVTTSKWQTNNQTAEKLELAFCTFDQQLSVLIDGDQVGNVTLNATTDMAAELAKRSEPLEWPNCFNVETEKLNQEVKLGPIKIFRDVYYYAENGPSEFELGPDEFLLLGDNVPVSIDSRTWNTPAISREQIIGTVDLKQEMLSE